MSGRPPVSGISELVLEVEDSRPPGASTETCSASRRSSTARARTIATGTWSARRPGSGSGPSRWGSRVDAAAPTSTSRSTWPTRTSTLSSSGSRGGRRGRGADSARPRPGDLRHGSGRQCGRVLEPGPGRVHEGRTRGRRPGDLPPRMNEAPGLHQEAAAGRPGLRGGVPRRPLHRPAEHRRPRATPGGGSIAASPGG